MLVSVRCVMYASLCEVCGVMLVSVRCVVCASLCMVCGVC